MSNKSHPRILYVSKLPKGKFTWKVTLRLNVDGEYFSSYERYNEEVKTLSDAALEYLEHNLSGNYSLITVSPKHFRNKRHKKYEAILFDNQVDVMLFKLVHGDCIRQIYQIKVAGEE